MSDETSTEPTVEAPRGETAQERAFRILREPFPASQIGLLPRNVRKDDKERFACVEGPNLRRASRDGKWCGGYHALSIHLDYVGHAALTARLLDADPAWSWEPLAFDEQGLPRLDRNGALWIRLTVAGVTRLGYGDAQGKSGPNAVKEAIGDALRNAGMRFGAALDLWSKEDLHADDVARGSVEDDAVASPPNGAGPAPSTGEAAPQPQAAAERTMPEEIRSQWRVHIMSREYLGNDPRNNEPKDGGLRWAYQDARAAGVLEQRVEVDKEETFGQLLVRLREGLPERPPEEPEGGPMALGNGWGDDPAGGWGGGSSANGAHTR